ncbi:hypothetical protein ACFWM0_29260, partial [Streptomyces sp. NPDC058405]
MSRPRRVARAAVGGAAALAFVSTPLPFASAGAGAGANANAAGAAAAESVSTTALYGLTPTKVNHGQAVASGFGYGFGDAGPQSWQAVAGRQPTGDAGPANLASGDDVRWSAPGSATVELTHLTSGVAATVAVPPGQAYRAVAGWSVVTAETAAPGELHVLRTAADGGTTDTPVTGFPSGAEPVAGSFPGGGTVRWQAVTYKLDGAYGVGVVDLADGSFRTTFSGLASVPAVRYNDRWIVAKGSGVQALALDSPPGTAPTPVGSIGSYGLGAVVGDHLLIAGPDFVPAGTDPELRAVSLTTGATTVLRGYAAGTVRASLDGGALVAAGTKSSDWAVQRFLPGGAGGLPVGEKVLDVPAQRAAVDALLLAGGELMAYGNPSVSAAGMYSIPLDAAGKPLGTQTRKFTMLLPAPCPAGDAACPQVEALGDGRVAYLSDQSGKESVHVAGREPNVYGAVPTNSTGGRIGGGSGRYVLYNGGTPSTQLLGDYPDSESVATALTRTRTAASIWGQRLWTPGATSGTVTGYDVKAKKTVATYDVGAPCTPSELQAVGHWLYWSCGTAGPAGVFDRADLRSISVPSGQARLADGYLVRENRSTHELLLTDFHTGTATTRTLATLPAADVNTGGYSGRWAVDKFGGHVAYLTADRTIEIVPTGVPTLPLTVTESQIEEGAT